MLDWGRSGGWRAVRRDTMCRPRRPRRSLRRSRDASHAPTAPSAWTKPATHALRALQARIRTRRGRRPAAPARGIPTIPRQAPTPWLSAWHARQGHRRGTPPWKDRRARVLASAATASTEQRPHVKPVPVAASVQRGPKRVDVLSTESTTPCGAASKVIGEFCREQERSSFLHALQVIGLSTAVVTIFKHVSSVPKANTSQTLWWESALYVQVQRHV